MPRGTLAKCRNCWNCLVGFNVDTHATAVGMRVFFMPRRVEGLYAQAKGGR